MEKVRLILHKGKTNDLNVYNPNIYDIDGLIIRILWRKLSKAGCTYKCPELAVPVVWFNKTRRTLSGYLIVKLEKKYVDGFMISPCTKFHIYFLPCFWTL